MNEKIKLLQAEADKIRAEAELKKAENWRPTVIGGNNIVDTTN